MLHGRRCVALLSARPADALATLAVVPLFFGLVLLLSDAGHLLEAEAVPRPIRAAEGDVGG